MATTTLGVKVNKEMQNRLRAAAEKIDVTPHWIMRHALTEWVGRIEGGQEVRDLVDLVEIEKLERYRDKRDEVLI